jgi:hypothetical protein
MERGPALTQNRKTLKAADFINDSGKEKGERENPRIQSFINQLDG